MDNLDPIAFGILFVQVFCDLWEIDAALLGALDHFD
jgi:hypothetical protein